MSLPARWHFRVFRPGDNASDPEFAGALFTRDDSSVARSLVREAIQNSLDARRAGGTSVRVRFALRTGSRAPTAKETHNFFVGLWPHIASPNSEVEDPPNQQESVQYLVVEDFGTRGLTGDPGAWDPFSSEKNSFFLFFRALGRTGKEGEDRGRWGVGKFVFPMASRGHCLLALTIAETEHSPLIMGRAVLKTHRTGQTTYHPDGHWGVQHESGLVLPANDSRMVEELLQVFDLERRQEPGLSVLVPWVHDGITMKALKDATVGEYFLPILRGELTVEADDNGTADVIDADRLMEMTASIESPATRARITLGLHAATCPDGELLYVPDASGGSEYDWDTGRLTPEQCALASANLELGKVVGFRVPTRVRPKKSTDEYAHFDVFLQRVQGLGRSRPLIVREGITISQDKTPFLQDCASLLIVDDRPLASFVGDAETPAHNELQNDLVSRNRT